MSELEAVSIRKFRFRSTGAASARAELEALAEVVEPLDVPSVLSDVADDEVLAAAAAGGAEVVVTGDRDVGERPIERQAQGNPLDPQARGNPQQHLV